MVAVLKIRKVGNSAAVILPKEELDRLHLGIGDELVVERSDDGLHLSPYDKDFARKVELFEGHYRRYRNAYRELAK
jgi:putative addiction module antidote